MRRSLAPNERRLLNIALACAVAVAMVGFFTGTHGTPTPGGYSNARGEQGAQRLPTAPKNRGMELVRYQDRRVQERTALNHMATPPRGLQDAVVLDAAAYSADVRARKEARAYDGAPPTIPHDVEQRGAPACLACHERGLSVEGKVAPMMSHTSYSQCMQCHTTRGPARRVDPAFPEPANSFVGLESPGHGERAWPSAPPQMPHRSFMRERCVSCHGVWAKGLASSHPWRQNCRQCHEPAATADQVPRSTFGALGWGQEDAP